MWAVLLGVVMILAATTSSHAATVARSVSAHGVPPAAITRGFGDIARAHRARGSE
jgi:hypothetical protein